MQRRSRWKPEVLISLPIVDRAGNKAWLHE
jgi:hypothetical protein